MKPNPNSTPANSAKTVPPPNLVNRRAPLCTHIAGGLIAIVLLLTAGSRSWGQLVSTAHGNIHDSTFSPIEGAVITFFGVQGSAAGLHFSTASDQFGNYAVMLPINCSYSVTCQANGYLVGTSFVNAYGPATPLDFQLQPTSPVINKPTIVRQPDDTAINAGQDAVLLATASGAQPLAYVWRKNGTNLLDGPVIFGSRSNILSFHGATAAESGG
jgi:hypothetical protein